MSKKKSVAWHEEAEKRATQKGAKPVSTATPAPKAPEAVPVSAESAKSGSEALRVDVPWSDVDFSDCGELLYPHLREWGRERLDRVMRRRMARHHDAMCWGDPFMVAIVRVFPDWPKMTHEARIEGLVGTSEEGAFKYAGWAALTAEERREVLTKCLCACCGRAPVHISSVANGVCPACHNG